MSEGDAHNPSSIIEHAAAGSDPASSPFQLSHVVSLVLCLFCRNAVVSIMKVCKTICSVASPAQLHQPYFATTITVYPYHHPWLGQEPGVCVFFFPSSVQPYVVFGWNFFYKKREKRLRLTNIQSENQLCFSWSFISTRQIYKIVVWVLKDTSSWRSVLWTDKPKDTDLKTGAESCEVGTAIAIG